MVSREEIIVYCDNWNAHKTPYVINLCNEKKIKILFSAIYSPHIDPIEYCFGYIKSKIRMSNCVEKYLFFKYA